MRIFFTGLGSCLIDRTEITFFEEGAGHGLEDKLIIFIYIKIDLSYLSGPHIDVFTHPLNVPVVYLRAQDFTAVSAFGTVYFGENGFMCYHKKLIEILPLPALQFIDKLLVLFIKVLSLLKLTL